MINLLKRLTAQRQIMRLWGIRIMALLSLVILAIPTHAETWRVGLFSGQWADTRLPYLPYNAVTGRLKFDDSYLHSLVVSHHLVSTNIFFPGTSLRFRDMRLEVEGTASLHDGLQSHRELTLGIMLRSRDIDAGSYGSVNFGCAWAR